MIVYIIIIYHFTTASSEHDYSHSVQWSLANIQDKQCKYSTVFWDPGLQIRDSWSLCSRGARAPGAPLVPPPV